MIFEKFDPFVGVELFDVKGTMVSYVYNLLDIFRESEDVNSLKNSLYNLDENFEAIIDEILCNREMFISKIEFDGKWNHSLIRNLKIGVYQKGEDWKKVSNFVFLDENYAAECEEKFNSIKDIYSQITVKEWIGPGAAFHFMKNIDLSKLNKAREKGFSLSKTINARAEATNSIVIKSYPLHVAAFANMIRACEFFCNNGSEINKIDSAGNTPLTYAIPAYFQSCAIFFLTKGIKIQDNKTILSVLEMDDLKDRLALYLCYSDNLSNLIKACKKSDNDEVKRFLDCFSYEKPYCYSSCRAFIEYYKPDFEGKIRILTNYIENDLIEVAKRINNFNIDAINKENIDEQSKAMTKLIIEFTEIINKFRSESTDARAEFADFSPSLDLAKEKIKCSIDFLGNKDPNFIRKAIDDIDMSPFIHCAISQNMKGKNSECLEFFQQLLAIISEHEKSILNYHKIFDEMNAKLKKNADLFMSCISKIEFISSFIDSIYHSLLTKKTFASLSDIICSKKHQDRQSTDLDSDLDKISKLRTDFMSSQASFKMSVINCRIPLVRKPKLFKETDRDLLLMNINQNMEECNEIIEEIEDTKDAKQEILEKRVLCSHCGQYVACFICPICGFPISCMKCGGSDKECPRCHKSFIYPFRLKKNGFYGKEFVGAVDL